MRYERDPPLGTAKVKIFFTEVTIFSGSQILALPRGSVLVVPARTIGAPGCAQEFLPNGEVVSHRDILAIEVVS